MICYPFLIKEVRLKIYLKRAHIGWFFEEVNGRILKRIKS
jgi:hypothetical protein